jgi:hypothetical protein
MRNEDQLLTAHSQTECLASTTEEKELISENDRHISRNSGIGDILSDLWDNCITIYYNQLRYRISMYINAIPRGGA